MLKPGMINSYCQISEDEKRKITKDVTFHYRFHHSKIQQYHFSIGRKVKRIVNYIMITVQSVENLKVLQNATISLFNRLKIQISGKVTTDERIVNW